MITVLGMWDPVWMDPERTERRIWKQTIQAFAVDRWAMCGVRGGPFTSPIQYYELGTMLDAHPGRRTFLVPPGRVGRSQDLRTYEHPASPIYVFGNTSESMADYMGDGDDAVTIHTPRAADMFGHAVLCAVLYDRRAKRVD